MKRRAFLSLSAAAGLGISPLMAVAQRNSSRSKSPALDLDRKREVTKVPGIAVAGTLNGKPVQLFNGYRNAAATPQQPIDVKTGFPAASLSKPVFAWAVRDLVAQGKLDWNRPLQDYTPLGLTGESSKITAAHALTHTSGLPNWLFEAGKPLEVQFKPGTRWQYSGEGIFLLQRVVEKITGTPMGTFIWKAVLEPFGMNSSSFVWTPQIGERNATGHDSNGVVLERSLAFYEQRNYETLYKAGVDPELATYEQMIGAYEKAKRPGIAIALSPNMAGSLQTTATDYAKFLGRVAQDRLVRADDFKPRVELNSVIAWTFGFGIDRSFGSSSFFHSGDGPGFKNFAWVQPEKKTSLVFFTNGDRGANLYAWVFRNLLSEDPAAFYWA